MAEIKVYEAKTLVSAAEKRAKQYEELKEQLNQLKKQFLDIVNSGDEFQGKGAEAIKGFYSAQVDVVEAWMRLIDKNIAFLRGIPGSTEDAKLSGDTFVQMSFLEENVPRAQNRAKEMVQGQQDALQSIFRSIADLVLLHVFSTDTFENHMAKAEKERTQTIDAVNQLDQALTEEYAISENDQSYLVGLFGQLLESSRQGSTITPINFDAKAYQNSEIYKMKKDIENSSKEYLAFKNDQAEARKQAKIAEELENRPWYEKAWDTTKTFTGEVSGYYDYKRATEGVDPVTGEKLTDAQRIAAGAMAAAGFIPVVGWAGRAVKGGSAIYKTVKAYNAADHALDAYKTSKSFSTLQKTEMGIYGLVSANGLGEAVLGKDMFGNQLTDQQRQQSLMQAIGILGVGGAAYGLDKLAAKRGGLLPYSNRFVNQKIEHANAILTDIGRRVGNIPVPIRVKSESLATNTGLSMSGFNVEYKALGDIISFAKSNVVYKGTGKDLSKVKVGKADLDNLRKKWNVPETHTIAVGKTDVKGLEDLSFEGGSPKVRKEAGLPSLDELYPNREIKAPYNRAIRGHAQFMDHAEEGTIAEFEDAVKKAGLKPEDVKGTLYINQSNPNGICNKCTKGLFDSVPDDERGIFKQLTDMFPNLKIDVSTEIDPSLPYPRDTLSFEVINGIPENVVKIRK
ncbi:ribonuclease YeeF family protein [Bacillus sp. V2I10]|uniref:ribonuclease YeeF family protein n=1 Tax=Bacillus sp. V2I10 TaxID=3042276 RepID=UPI0027843E32|nr:T7SS effector LXG polymorphic toxin [Bacillus sp. V2I10]MDQ0861807.1 putative ribonuclease toxin of YeeF-YezG toxin-antitoxin module [Bacillus sp. V2I10]